MQPDFGTAAYNPQGQFAFNRSYVTKLIADVATGVAVYVPGLITIVYPLPDPVTELILLRDYFHAWSSNSYTLDGIVASISYSFASAPLVIFPAHISVTYMVTGNPPAPSIVITPHLQGGLHQTFPLPPAPADYWVKV
jgi:hypothetical protein